MEEIEDRVVCIRNTLFEMEYLKGIRNNESN